MAKKQARRPVRPKPARKAEVTVHTVPPLPAPALSFRQRLARLMARQPAGLASSRMAEATSEVRAGVMNELRKSGTATKPFDKILLPLPRRKPVFPTWALAVLALLVVGGGLIWWLGRDVNGAALSLHRIERALDDRNAAAFERLVDLPQLGASVADQISAQPAEASSFQSRVRARLQNGVQPGLTPTMAETLADESLAAVASGRWPDQPDSLLAQLWRQLGGDKASFGHPRVVTATETRAEAELPLSRDDIALDVALKLVLEKREPDWVVTDIPNFAQALALVDEAEFATAALPDLEAIEPSAALSAAPVEVSLVGAAKRGDRVEARVKLANMSGLPVHNLPLRLTIGDANGVPLKQLVLSETGTLAPTQTLEKTYTLKLNRKQRHDRVIATLPLSAFTVRAEAAPVAP